MPVSLFRYVGAAKANKSVFGAMVLACVAFVVFIQFYFYDLADGLPIKLPAAGPVLSRDAVAASYEQFADLVNSVENKKVFTQLADADSAFFDKHSNVVGTTQFRPTNHFHLQPYVANGYIGSRIPNLGQGFTFDQLSTPDSPKEEIINGWPLDNTRYSGAFIAGFYDLQPNVTRNNFFVGEKSRAYESVIAAVPQWTTLQVTATINSTVYVLDPALGTAQQGSVSQYVQFMSMETGIVTTEYTWLNTLRVKYEVLAHRETPTLGLVSLEIHNLNDTAVNLTVTDVLDFSTSERTQLLTPGFDENGVYITFQPHLVESVYGAIFSKLATTVGVQPNRVKNDTSSSQKVDFDLGANCMVAFSKTVGVVSSDLYPKEITTEYDVLRVARNTALAYHDTKAIVKTHKAAWKDTLGSKLAVTFPDDDLLTMAARASLYHLAANTRSNMEGVAAALGVSGLSSDSYAGMVFWDSDLWMLNGILPFLPSHARSIVNYRAHTHQQAIENLRDGDIGAVYPWTSGRYGNCTGTGPCFDYEYHINTAVAFGAWQVYLSGHGNDTFLEEVAWPLINDAALFMSNYVKYNDTLKQYTTHNLTDPDEFANHVDNGAYTNAATSLLMKIAGLAGAHLGKDVNSTFSQIAGNIHIPVSEDHNIVLEYTGMNSSAAIKQADVIMLTYPLENELISKEQAIVNMHYYAMRQVSYGPAMTFPIFSIVSSALSTSGCSSQAYLQKAVQPFMRAPFAQFSEQNNDNYATNGGTAPAFPFLTAHGGFLQAILQGLFGLRFDYVIDGPKIDRVLTIDPVSTPLLPNGVHFDGIEYMGTQLIFDLNKDGCTITNKGSSTKTQDSESSITINVGQRNPKTGRYELKVGESLTFPVYETIQAQSGSISECQLATFYNVTESVYGDATLAINDGDNFTHWQSTLVNETSKVLIDLHAHRNITRGWINWGEKPPLAWKLSSYNGREDNVLKLFASVDFGDKSYEKFGFVDPDLEVFKQDEVFSRVIEEDVQITAPYNQTEFLSVMLPTSFNSTSFSTKVEGRFLLLEFEGVHSENDETGGAKIYEVAFF